MPLTRRQFLAGALTGASYALLAKIAAAQTVRTPYDSGVFVWHWKGDVVPESTIEGVIGSLKQTGPLARGLIVKTSDGPQWAGVYDSRYGPAIDGPTSIDRWVKALQDQGFEFHAWCVPNGLDVQSEADLIIQACNRPGVKSMILDVESYQGFWTGPQEAVSQFMRRIRGGIAEDFHIGISVDPRRANYDAIFADEWQPFVDSVHPQMFWNSLARTAADVFSEAYDVWGGYGPPIIPNMQGLDQASVMLNAVSQVTDDYLAPAITWWRMGEITADGWAVIEQAAALVARQYG